MSTPTPPAPLPPTAPLTPLGARTPHAHPALYGVIAFLSLVIIVGAVLLFWPRGAIAPSLTPTPGAPSDDASDYLNPDLGLLVSLPDEWSGYGITMFEWTAYGFTASGTEQEAARGPNIHIVHPSVAGGNPHQEIPIMVFTLEQWGHVGAQSGDWSVSAAPVPPTELARNARYVFALPARYNFGALPGWEDVDELLRNGAVSAFDI